VIRLGIIGMSEGNGHPYSWSAICNGYDRQAMADCPFPTIPDYLSKQSLPQARLEGAVVTHVWTQDSAVSRHIAQCCHIANVSSSPEDMIGEVDGLLLARDDPEHHLKFSEPFLRSGLPVYIDKPIAQNLDMLRHLRDLARTENQLFTCSALRYARELEVTPDVRAMLGTLRHVDICVPKDWGKYIIHGLEPVVSQFDELGAVESSRPLGGRNYSGIEVEFSSGVSAILRAFGAIPSPISFHLYGDKAEKAFTFRDPFNAFKAALQSFITQIRTGTTQMDWNQTEKIVELIHLGMKK
jgi:hypothetical protein